MLDVQRRLATAGSVDIGVDPQEIHAHSDPLFDTFCLGQPHRSTTTGTRRSTAAAPSVA